jgi:putative ABC transport system ATP-binding protein
MSGEEDKKEEPSEEKKEEPSEDKEEKKERKKVITPAEVKEGVEQMVVETQNVRKVYEMGGGKIEVKALDGVNARIAKGDFVAFMGPSGSGKTTFLNIISGLDRPSEGEVFMSGREITKMDQAHLSKLRQQNVGFIFQIYNLIPVLTAIENVELPMVFAGIGEEERKERAMELLERVGLGDRVDHRPTELSGGEQQRVAIARALVNKPDLVLADEPTGNLDTKTGLEIIDLMKSLQKEEGTTVIVATHDPKVADVVDIITYLRDGQVIGESVQREDLGEAQEIGIKASTEMTQEILNQIHDDLLNAMYARKVKVGDKISLLDAEFEIATTDPTGLVRVMRDTRMAVAK